MSPRNVTACTILCARLPKRIWKETLRKPAAQRFSQHYCDVLAAANDLYLKGGEVMKQGLIIFDLEWGNIRAGRHGPPNIRPRITWPQLFSTAYPSLGINCIELRLQPRERIVWLEIAIVGARKLKDRGAEAQHLGNLGIAYRNLGEYHLAIGFYEQCLKIAREMGDRRMEGNALGNLGVAFRNLNDYPLAIKYQDQRRQIAVDVGDRRGECTALGNLGSIYASQEKWDKALESYEKALEDRPEIRDQRIESNTLGNMGAVYSQFNKNEIALKFQQKGLQIAIAIGDLRSQGERLWNMSLVFDQLNERGKAIDHAEAALKVLIQIESPHAAVVSEQLAKWR